MTRRYLRDRAPSSRQGRETARSRPSTDEHEHALRESWARPQRAGGPDWIPRGDAIDGRQGRRCVLDRRFSRTIVGWRGCMNIVLDASTWPAGTSTARTDGLSLRDSYRSVSRRKGLPVRFAIGDGSAGVAFAGVLALAGAGFVAQLQLVGLLAVAALALRRVHAGRSSSRSGRRPFRSLPDGGAG